jgi:hypothetical protein
MRGAFSEGHARRARRLPQAWAGNRKSRSPIPVRADRCEGATSWRARANMSRKEADTPERSKTDERDADALDAARECGARQQPGYGEVTFGVALETSGTLHHMTAQTGAEKALSRKTATGGTCVEHYSDQNPARGALGGH